MIIVQKFLQYLMFIKIYHWSTQKYGRHKASDQLFSELQTSMDRFVELYIGVYGRKEVLKGKAELELRALSDKEASALLDRMAIFLNTLDDHLKDTSLLNVRDEILGHVNQARYLFTLE